MISHARIGNDFVMPAGIAGIQVRKDASRNIRVSLGSSTPCWNDAIEKVLLELSEVPLPARFLTEYAKLRPQNIQTLHGLWALRPEFPTKTK